MGVDRGRALKGRTRGEKMACIWVYGCWGVFSCGVGGFRSLWRVFGACVGLGWCLCMGGASRALVGRFFALGGVHCVRGWRWVVLGCSCLVRGVLVGCAW